MKNKLNYITVIMLLIIANGYTIACPVCDRQQPKITRGWTHGAGPQSNWDWIIIAVVAIITLITLLYSIKCLIKPGERNPSHIKNSIFSN